MMKSKKILAIVLATSMMFGSSITALADGATGTTGAGTNEGHVEKEVINVVLPTIAEGSTPFAYTMDPERLITATSAAAYSSATFPSSNDTGVYFKTGDTTYANTSSELTITNKSSCDVDISVKVKAVASEGGKDIALAESSTVSTTAGSPDLYLGLKVGTDTTVVSAEEKTVTKKVEGVASNFEIQYDSSAKKYKYVEKSSPAAWKDIKISMTGAVSEMDVPEGTTAPTISATWSFAKHVEGPSLSVTSGGVITVTGLTADQNYVSLTMTGEVEDGTTKTFHVNNDPTAVSWDESEYDAETGGNLTCTLTKAWGAWWDSQKAGQTITVTLTLSDDTTKTATVVLDKE